MAWFEDLEHCSYFGSQPADKVLAVGWLQQGHPYPTGEVAPEVFARLVELCRDPWQPVIAAGSHSCDLCLSQAEALCSAGLFIPGDGVLYVTTTLITHYMNAHGYRPPQAFRLAVLACPAMRSMAYLRSILACGGRPLIQSGRRLRPDRGASEIQWHPSRTNTMTRRLTALIEREEGGYVALCPELDIASQGDTVESARDNLKEALELFFEVAPPEEIARRLPGEVYVTQVEVVVG